MGRAALAWVGIAAAVAVAAPPLAGAATPRPRTALESFACHRSSDSFKRWIEVTAVMRPISGTQHMEMKFQLLRKPRQGHTFVDVSSGDLGKWLHPKNRTPPFGSRPGDHWSVQKPVVNPPAQAVYRFRVSFRWLGQKAQPLGTVVRLSRECTQ
jgi:hypothetical protein